MWHQNDCSFGWREPATVGTKSSTIQSSTEASALASLLLVTGGAGGHQHPTREAPATVIIPCLLQPRGTEQRPEHPREATGNTLESTMTRGSWRNKVVNGPPPAPAVSTRLNVGFSPHNLLTCTGKAEQQAGLEPVYMMQHANDKVFQIPFSP